MKKREERWIKIRFASLVRLTDEQRQARWVWCRIALDRAGKRQALGLRSPHGVTWRLKGQRGWWVCRMEN
jgi:hypothetical protein